MRTTQTADSENYDFTIQLLALYLNFWRVSSVR